MIHKCLQSLEHCYTTNDKLNEDGKYNVKKKGKVFLHRSEHQYATKLSKLNIL